MPEVYLEQGRIPAPGRKQSTRRRALIVDVSVVFWYHASHWKGQAVNVDYIAGLARSLMNAPGLSGCVFKI